jgi:hypothetical protein
VIVRVEATPINPSDLGLLLAGGDVNLAKIELLNDIGVVRDYFAVVDRARRRCPEY